MSAEQQTSQARLAIVTLCVCLCGFLSQLDRTVVTTAIPNITNEFHSYIDFGWYGSAYLMTSMALQPMYGRLYSLFDTKVIFVAAMVLFEIGSIVCASAPSSVALIIGRAITGAGGAGLLTGTFVALMPMLTETQRPLFTAMVAIVFNLGSMSGPLIGGAFTSKSTWRWCFWINLPIGIPALIGLIFFFKPVKAAKADSRQHATVWSRIQKLDFVGNVLIFGSCIMLLLALQKGAEVTGWGTVTVIGLLVGSGCTFAAFLVWIWTRGDAGLIPPRILCNRVALVSSLTQFLLWSVMFIHFYFLPLYFQAIIGQGAITSGVNMIAYVIPATFGGILAGAAVSKTGLFTPPCVLGAAILTIGSGLIYTLGPGSHVGLWIGFMIVAGFGLGMSTQQGFIAVQRALAPSDLAMGTALINLACTLGGAVFVSVGNSIILSSLHISDVPGIDVNAIIAAGATAFRDFVPAQMLGQFVQTYNDAIAKVFLGALVMSAISVLTAMGMFSRIELKHAAKPEDSDQESASAGDSSASETGGEK